MLVIHKNILQVGIFSLLSLSMGCAVDAGDDKTQEKLVSVTEVHLQPDGKSTQRTAMMPASKARALIAAAEVRLSAGAAVAPPQADGLGSATSPLYGPDLCWSYNLLLSDTYDSDTGGNYICFSGYGLGWLANYQRGCCSNWSGAVRRINPGQYSGSLGTVVHEIYYPCSPGWSGYGASRNTANSCEESAPNVQVSGI